MYHSYGKLEKLLKLAYKILTLLYHSPAFVPEQVLSKAQKLSIAIHISKTTYMTLGNSCPKQPVRLLISLLLMKLQLCDIWATQMFSCNIFFHQQKKNTPNVCAAIGRENTIPACRKKKVTYLSWPVPSEQTLHINYCYITVYAVTSTGGITTRSVIFSLCSHRHCVPICLKMDLSWLPWFC